MSKAVVSFSRISTETPTACSVVCNYSPTEPFPFSLSLTFGNMNKKKMFLSRRKCEGMGLLAMGHFAVVPALVQSETKDTTLETVFKFAFTRNVQFSPLSVGTSGVGFRTPWPTLVSKPVTPAPFHEVLAQMACVKVNLYLFAFVFVFV